MMSALTPIASILRAVSMVDSPLLVLEPLAVRLTTSADKNWAARVKLMRVRVESSKKRLAMQWFLRSLDLLLWGFWTSG